MISPETAHYYIERHIDFGEPLPPEVERFLDLHPQHRDYLHQMRRVADTLRKMEIHPPSPALIDAVMDRIATQESTQPSPWYLYFVHPVINLCHTFQNILHTFQIDPVLKREAWPAVFATLSIVVGILILPQTEPERSGQLHTSVADKLTTLTDEAYEKVERVAKQINAFAAGIIRGVSGEETAEDTKKNDPEDEVGLKYTPALHRTVWEETVELS